MERKKRAPAARTARRQSSDAALTTSHQNRAQSDLQNQPYVQASRAQTTQTAHQGPPGQSPSRPRAQVHAYHQFTSAAISPQQAIQIQQPIPIPYIPSYSTTQRPLFARAGPQQSLHLPTSPGQPHSTWYPQPQHQLQHNLHVPTYPAQIQPGQHNLHQPPPALPYATVYGHHFMPDYQLQQLRLQCQPTPGRIPCRRHSFDSSYNSSYKSPHQRQPVQYHYDYYQAVPQDLAQGRDDTLSPIRPINPTVQSSPLQFPAPTLISSLHSQRESRIRFPRERSPISPSRTQPPKIPRASFGAYSSVSGLSPSSRIAHQISFEPLMSGTISCHPSELKSPQQQCHFEAQPEPSYIVSQTHYQLITPGPSTSDVPGSEEPIMTAMTQPEPSTLGPARPNPRKKSSEMKNEKCRYTIPNKVPENIEYVNLLCNYYSMELSPTELIRYDISFKPDKPKRLVKLAYDTMKRDLFPEAVMAFDQSKICIVTEPLPEVGERYVTDFDVSDTEDRTVRFEVTIIKTGVFNFNTLIEYTRDPRSSLNQPTAVIQLLDIILRQGTLESYIKAGRQFFKRPPDSVDLGYGLEMWTGLFQSAIITNKMFINVDVAHKGFPKNEKLTDLLEKDFNLSPTLKIEAQWPNEKFMEFLKDLRVVVPIHTERVEGSCREFIVNQLVKSPEEENFDHTNVDGETQNISVHHYFTDIKGVHIKFPNLNCVWVGKKKSILYPMEMLTVASGQLRNKQLNEEQLSKMVKNAATPPQERINKIKEITSAIKYSTNPEYRNFGVTINDSNFHTVRGKILASPMIKTGNSSVRPINGVWGGNDFKGLCHPVPFPKWILLAVNWTKPFKPLTFIERITAEGLSLGVRIQPPFIDQNIVHTIEELSIRLGCYINDGFKLAFIALPSLLKSSNMTYHEIKKVAECNVGMLTQCIKPKNLETVKKITLRNILLKVNAKLMGINHKLDENSVPRGLIASERDYVMVVGVDVTHPPPDQRKVKIATDEVVVPSIAAVVASTNDSHTIYNLEMSMQQSTEEIISNFRNMMIDHFRVFRACHGSLPNKIYVYRDGVSDGHFSKVLNDELEAIFKAYATFTTHVKPKVLFMIVQKRHHTRLFREDYRNVLPGTLVDVDIVHPRELDFYLVSHQAIKGTARPTRYHQIYNDTDLNADEVQKMTYYLCYLFARCTRSVSYPAPTYYAHLACLRARSLNNKKVLAASLPCRFKVNEELQELNSMFFV